MGPGKKNLAWVGLGQIFVVLIGSAIFGLGLTLENFLLKSQIFQFFPLGSDGSGSKFFDLGRVGSAIHGLGLENFP